MEKIVEQTLLFDFYGELLTDHQRKVYEEVILNDYSLSEVAENMGISRQGVHDLIKRSGKILDDYERKLHLVKRFISIKDKANQIRSLSLTTISKLEDGSALMKQIEDISNEILEEL
jgi:Uncharacterized protein conserved in bacteria